MDRQAIEQAIETLRGAGESVSARKIRKLLLAQGVGQSFRDIYAVMRDLGALVVGEASDALEEMDEDLPADPAPAEGDADAELPADDEPDELPPAAIVAEAEAALQAAEQRLQQLEAEQQPLAGLITAGRAAVLQGVGRQLAATEARKARPLARRGGRSHRWPGGAAGRGGPGHRSGRAGGGAGVS